MDRSDDANWWLFAVDPQSRGNRITAGTGGTREVNPALPDGRRILDYRSYIGLDKLLSCQVPSSLVPDERVFIVTHQLFELVFKQIIFDLAVVAATFARLLAVADATAFRSLCATADDDFWLPALTASGRIGYGSETVLPALAGYLARNETFSSAEFRRFRPNLIPASGFQSAQFRLIQRGLGKGTLLAVRLFPAEEYWKNYEAAADRGPARVVDPVILRDDAAIADPPPDSPLAPVARLDDSAHLVLERLAGAEVEAPGGPGIRLISVDDVGRAVDDFCRILAGQRSQQEKAGQKPADAEEKDRSAAAIFRHDLESAVRRENGRRAALATARCGALHLRRVAPRGCLAQVLDRLASADSALFGKQDESFISLHFRLVAARFRDLFSYAREAGEAAPPQGTGGGGVPYLAFARSSLIPHFPALVAWLDLKELSASG